MKVFISVSISAVLLFVAGAWKMQRTQESFASLPSDSPSAGTGSLVEEKVPKMWTNSSTIYKGDSFDLNFSAPNAPFLGVIDPAGHFFYVVFPKEDAVGKLKPLVGSAQFASLHTLKIRTSTLKADPYTYGVYTNQPVFTRSGTYTFILGENLHIDDPNFVDKVVIHYVHSRRPARNASTDVAMN
ncbi:MAG: hypothetical protein IT260_14330 [Saprospiraceae bacterium]|nr:hypothetical protein [Saprospiraceae bacterium]